MGENSAISWTDHTSNAWWGCTEVTSACDNCYARIWAKRIRNMDWGKGTPRVKIKSAYKDLRKWDRKARQEGIIRKVFAHSMSDVFDQEVPDEWRFEEFKVWGETTNLIFQVLTKRPTQPLNYGTLYPVEKIWLGTSIGSNKDLTLADKIVLAPAKLHWISYEPAIGPLDVSLLPAKIKWVVIGGESGKEARPFDIQWGIDVINACKARGIAVFFKQLGSKPVWNGKAWAIKDFKGDDTNEWPHELQIQEFPE